MKKAMLSAAALALLALVVRPSTEAAATESDANAPVDARMSETDMSHTGSTPQGTVTVPWNLLGGTVGNQTVNGVRVELYVLQAQEPDKLKAGDPNHAFTVTLKDGKSSEFLKEGDVSLAVVGNSPTQKISMPRGPTGIFRSGVDLPRPGQYRITVAFKTGGRAGQAEFPYVYRPLGQAAQTHHHSQ